MTGDRYQLVIIDKEIHLLVTLGPILGRADARKRWQWDFDKEMNT